MHVEVGTMMNVSLPHQAVSYNTKNVNCILDKKNEKVI